MHSADELSEAGMAVRVQHAVSELRERARHETDDDDKFGFAGLRSGDGLFALDNATAALEAAGDPTDSVR